MREKFNGKPIDGLGVLAQCAHTVLTVTCRGVFRFFLLLLFIFPDCKQVFRNIRADISFSPVIPRCPFRNIESPPPPPGNKSVQRNSADLFRR